MMRKYLSKSRVYFPHYLWLVLLLAMYSSAASAQGSAVLVAAENSPVQSISVLEIRRIYLGLPPSAESHIRKPVINLADQHVFKEFLKNIMHMTESGFRRKIVKQIFRRGGEKVVEIKSNAELIEYLNNNNTDVSFMDEKAAKKLHGIKVVQILW